MWEGKCNRCGECCIMDIKAVRNTEKDILHAVARGYNILAEMGNIVIASFRNRCPQLTDDNKCRLHGDGKPELCIEGPNHLNEFADILDLNLLRPDSCGYIWVEQ